MRAQLLGSALFVATLGLAAPAAAQFTSPYTCVILTSLGGGVSYPVTHPEQCPATASRMAMTLPAGSSFAVSAIPVTPAASVPVGYVDTWLCTWRSGPQGENGLGCTEMPKRAP